MEQLSALRKYDHPSHPNFSKAPRTSCSNRFV